ncbi:MAG: glutamine-hydrolyzing carbamoyl-phosphate synthase small subunit [Olegusella sp.]|nr:glutamine-hydrolyzing carbamoyl-phosphate synthase small subunit [Olegusella sp.]
MNLLVDEGKHPKALLALEDGTVFEGRSCGAAGETFGEVVFNTSMVGYQEIVSDPSYAGQIVTFTYPQVGNYGVNAIDMQRDVLHLRGVVVHDMCYTPSNWQCVQSFPNFLEERGVVAIEGVDTRALTLHLREAGAMQGAISTLDTDPASLVARVKAAPRIGDHNYVADVSTDEPLTFAPAQGAAAHRVVAYDCGEKTGIAKRLAAVGCEVTMVPWDTPSEDVLALHPDGVFFSNGPGDPQTVPPTVEAVRGVLGRVPVFGICLGNQVVSMAAGAQIEKLKYGHHGGNEPVMNLLTSKVEITAQNHNYGPVFPTFGPLVPELSGGYAEHADDLRFWSERHIAPVAQTAGCGRVRLTHVNLNDGTPEGLQFLDIPAFSMQYHPEAKPGPNDSTYAFVAFCRLMDGRDDYLAIDVREGRRF